MADMNVVALTGRLTRDAELKYTNSGMAICAFSVAVNRRRKQGDDWVDEANFFDVTLFGRRGEAIQRYLTKGTQVAVQAELRQDRWEQDGNRRSKIQIIANDIALLGGGSRGDGGGSGGGSYERGAPAGGPPRGGGGQGGGGQGGGDHYDDDSDYIDDVPF
ncbi:MAG: single-stranded DNA-binding protein [Alkalispirochaetaceae bacterium]